MYKYPLFFVLFLSVNCVFAQFKQFPIGFVPANAPKSINKNTSNNSQVYRGLPGVLPFFEDFSDNKTLPNADFWTNVGVVINNTRADNAPSVGVATLDAFDIKGTPYNIASPLSQGYSDTLTAKSIDLSAILPTATDVFLSFWWQAGGKVEAPDASDFLLLQGKDNANNWVEILRKYGDGTFTTFKQENIQLANRFFHSGFQFRFLRFGRVSGDFDAWHLDYIYLNQNRTLTDVTRQDVAFSRQPQSYLKNYTAMPVKQYFANQAAEINTEIITNVKNLDNIFRIISYDCELKNTRNNTILASLPITTTTSIIQPNDANFLVTATPQTLTNAPLNAPISLEYAFRLTSTDATAPVDFKVNDTIKGKTELDNYFAYDDGTAEYVAGIAQTQGKIAVQYKLNTPAVITDIDISFVPFKQNLSQETFILSIWKKVKGREDEILFQKSLQVKYPTSPNGFVRFAVDSTKIINIIDTFYVGIQQTSNDLLAIGFDKDNNAQTKTFFNIQGNWEQNPLIKGALMIRPVFDNDVFVPDGVTALNDNEGNIQDSILLFPNPSKTNENNIISIKSPKRIVNVHIYNTQGQTQEVIFDKENQQIVTKNLSKGLYMALLKDVNGKLISKKIVLE